MLPQDRSLHEIEIRIAQNEPFCAGGLEIHFDACMRALPFAIQDNAVAELAVTHALSEPYAEFVSSRRGHAVARRMQWP